MPQKTTIEWTDLSWNPIRARHRETGKVGWHCEHASDGCRFCYAETRNRWIGTGLPFTRQSREEVKLFLDKKRLRAPMPEARCKIFVCDMTDLFGEFVDDEWIDCILGVADFYPHHVFQLLTKRPRRMCSYFARPGLGQLPIANVWLGTSIESRRELDRLDWLRLAPAALRFISCEPLLEDLAEINLHGIDWVIAGAESDAWRRARPMQRDWVRHIRDQCIAANVPFFFKQDAVHGRKVPLPVLDGRVWREFPS
jgi:protein gp37